MFRDRIPTWGLISLIGLWLLHLALAGWWRTPMDVPILALLGLSLISLNNSIDHSLTVPKVHGLILGLALFYFVSHVLRKKDFFTWTLFGLLTLAIGVSVLGLVGTNWTSGGFLSLENIYKSLPRWINDIPRSIGDGGINSNIIGGGLTFFLPLLANLLWNNNDFKFIAYFKNKQLAKVMSIVFKVLLILALLMVTFTLILTQSRGSYLGAVIGLLALAIIKDKRYLWGIPLLAILFLTILQRTAQGDIKVFIDIIDSTRGGGTLPGRLEIWQRALFLIQDFPYTGVGIGTLSPITNMLYPYFHFSNPKVYHAHNMILTLAVDLGLPALVLYSALITSFVVMVIKTAQKAKPEVKALLIGMASGLLAHQVFGIMDAYMLGTKLGAIMWIFYGITAALYLNNDQQGEASSTSSSKAPNTIPQSRLETLNIWASKLAQGLIQWLLLSLLAIAFINISVILSLVLAVLGGIVLGIFLTKGNDLSSMLRAKNA